LNQKGGSMSKILGTIDLRYKAANVIMIYEWWIGKDSEGSDCNIILILFRKFRGGTEKKTQNSSFRIVDIQA
jgi:hypothetical protein